MAKIYTPNNPPPEAEHGITPHIEIIEGVLRCHFHKGGVSFGVVDDRDGRFARVLHYNEVRAILISAAAHAAGCGGAGG